MKGFRRLPAEFPWPGEKAPGENPCRGSSPGPGLKKEIKVYRVNVFVDKENSKQSADRLDGLTSIRLIAAEGLLSADASG